MTRIRVVDFASARRQNTTYTSRLPDSATIAMDSDLIKLVNRLQDTFNDLGMCMGLGQWAINLIPIRRGVGYAPAGCGQSCGSIHG